MIINQSIDIEEAVRASLAGYMTTYVAPLPKAFTVPCILVRAAGGGSESNAHGMGVVDAFTVTLDARAEDENDALAYIRRAVGIVEAVGAAQTAGFSAQLNSLYSWGVDPVRPDLAMCSATLVLTAHRDTITIEEE